MITAKVGVEMPEINMKDKEISKVWNSWNAYWDDQEKEYKARKTKWYTKVADFFKYTIWWRIQDWFYNMKWYIRNLKTFQPILKGFRSWDHEYVTKLFKFGLDLLATDIAEGHEERTSANKKVKAIRELIKELDYDYDTPLVDKYLDKQQKIKKITKYTDGSIEFEYIDAKTIQKQKEKYEKALKKARKAHYDKIFRIILGQDNDKVNAEFEKRKAELTDEERAKYEKDGYYYLWTEIFDGTGIETWWD